MTMTTSSKTRRATSTRSSFKPAFKLNHLAFAAAVVAASVAPQLAHAGAGWGTTTNPAHTNGKMQTFYANSPNGLADAAACFDAAGNVAVPAAAGLCDSGGFKDATGKSLGLRKFVDGLPGLTAANANAAGQFIPLAVPDTASYPGADYYEIAVVEYTQKMHSDLKKPTTLRGYVQIDPVATDAGTGPFPLLNADGSAAMISRPNGAGGFVLKQAFGVTAPHYLGPVISSTQGRPTRVKFYNALPVGRADATGRHGDIFLPVDETLPGAGFGPDGLIKYTQNRAELHLHGGDNPWISDGTPHQWITPAGEASAANGVAAQAAAAGVSATPYLRGPSALNVPDMPEPGPGAVTYYFPNGESARLMFYHDHSFGLTRLNVYAGEAAGYVLRDAKEIALTTTGPLAGVPEIPLIIQDKTFVPDNIAQQDARWDVAAWGTSGDLWFPHVYETNQDPNSLDATNPVGRWDWGPFFWPVFPSALDLPTGEHKIYAPGTRASYTNTTTGAALQGPSDFGMTEVTTTPEAFNDTPLVNGVAYPTMTVDPKAYRLRVLNVANDRMVNLGFYVAADAATVNPAVPFTAGVALCDGTQAAGVNCSEVRMVPFAGPNAPTATTFSCDPVTGLTPAAGGYTTQFPCAGGLMGTGWGAQDNRPGGVPDPTTAGPAMHLIGNEGGFLSAPVDIPSTPLNYEYNKRSVTVLNVLEHGLFLGPAVRADVVVDFSAYAGKTLILYNDAPAPLPAGDPRLDYYTGIGDQTTAGGAANTLPGYGPNTRTIMQVKVNALAAGATATPFNFAALDAAITANVAAGQQDKPIVPQKAYSPSFGTAAPFNTDTFANIFTGSVYVGNYKPITFTTTGPLSYTKAPGLTTKCTTPAACQTEINSIKAAGLTTVPAGTVVSAYVESKAIQELFDPTWGRMNATLGVELPFTTSTTQTTIPLGFVDPATEIVADGETQFWKITHNGVDSHPIHFHLVNVQVINRMGWDGTVKVPHPEEIGWKETVVMNPLEDVMVAVRAKKPLTPFGLPHSYRAMDPSQPVGANVTAGFTQVDAVTGNPKAVSNTMDDFLNEYVWHCHILGHEENDFMRPFKFNAKDVLPAAPTAITAAGTAGNVSVTWTDPTPATAANLGNAQNEIGFRVERALSGTTAFTPVATGLTTINAITQPMNTLANATAFVDMTTPVNVVAAPNKPTTSAATTNSVTVSWTLATGTTSATYAGFNVLRAPVTAGVAGAFTQVNTAALATTATSFVDTTAQPGTRYQYQVVGIGKAGTGAYVYRVAAVNAAGSTPSAASTAVSLATVGSNVTSASSAVATTIEVQPTLPATQAITLAATRVATFTWNPVPGAASYNVAYRTGTTATGGTYTAAVSVTGNTFSTPALAANSYVTFQVSAVSASGVASAVTTSATDVIAAAATPSTPVFSNATTTSLTANWTPSTTNHPENSFTVQQATNAAMTTGLVTTPLTALSYNAAGLAANTNYYYRVSATNGMGTSAYSAVATAATLPVAPAALAVTSVTRNLFLGTPLATDNVVMNVPAAGGNAPTTFSIDYATSATGPWSSLITGRAASNTAATAYTATVQRGAATAPAPTAYYFRVTFVNAAGSSAPGAVTAAVATK